MSDVKCRPSNEYGKIQSLFLRGDKGKFLPQFTEEEFCLLSNVTWVATEKIHGTNIRLYLDRDGGHAIHGKTDTAQIPPHLLEYLESVVEKIDIKNFISENFSDDTLGITLYGEGYGEKIQKFGSRYRDRADFILFDISIHYDGGETLVMKQNSISDISEKLSIPMTPTAFVGTLRDMVLYVARGFCYEVADDPTLESEGLVIRPVCELQDRRGERVITKLKTKDFRNIVVEHFVNEVFPN